MAANLQHGAIWYVTNEKVQMLERRSSVRDAAQSSADQLRGTNMFESEAAKGFAALSIIRDSKTASCRQNQYINRAQWWRDSSSTDPNRSVWFGRGMGRHSQHSVVSQSEQHTPPGTYGNNKMQMATGVPQRPTLSPVLLLAFLAL